MAFLRYFIFDHVWALARVNKGTLRPTQTGCDLATRRDFSADLKLYKALHEGKLQEIFKQDE